MNLGRVLSAIAFAFAFGSMATATPASAGKPHQDVGFSTFLDTLKRDAARRGYTFEFDQLVSVIPMRTSAESEVSAFAGPSRSPWPDLTGDAVDKMRHVSDKLKQKAVSHLLGRWTKPSQQDPAQPVCYVLPTDTGHLNRSANDAYRRFNVTTGVHFFDSAIAPVYHAILMERWVPLYGTDVTHFCPFQNRVNVGEDYFQSSRDIGFHGLGVNLLSLAKDHPEQIFDAVDLDLSHSSLVEKARSHVDEKNLTLFARLEWVLRVFAHHAPAYAERLIKGQGRGLKFVAVGGVVTKPGRRKDLDIAFSQHTREGRTLAHFITLSNDALNYRHPRTLDARPTGQNPGPELDLTHEAVTILSQGRDAATPRRQRRIHPRNDRRTVRTILKQLERVNSKANRHYKFDLRQQAREAFTDSGQARAAPRRAKRRHF